jgi:hypothetical protein
VIAVAHILGLKSNLDARLSADENVWLALSMR